MIEILRNAWPTLALMGGLTALFLLLRNRTSPVSFVDEAFKRGQPAVVEVFSNM